MMFKERYSALSNTERRVFWIVMALAILLAVFSRTVFDTLLGAPTLQYALVNAIPFFLMVVSLISASLLLFGRKEQGSWLLLAGTMAGLLVAASQAEGYGFPSAFVLLAVTLFIPLQILKRQKASFALAAGVLGTIAIIVVDAFWTAPRVPALAEDVVGAQIASGILGVIVLIGVMYQFRDLSISAKLLILALGTGLVSIILVAGFTSHYTQQALTAQTHESLLAAARYTIDEIDTYIYYNTQKLNADAQIPAIVRFLEASQEEQNETRGDLLKLLAVLAQSDTANVRSYALLNKKGIDVADTFTPDKGKDKSDRDYFIEPMKTALPYVSPVRFSPTTFEHAFYIGVPVFDENGSVLGVLRIRFNSSLLQEIVRSNNGFAGEGSYGILLDDYNVILAHGTNLRWTRRMLVKPDLDTFNLLRSQGRLPDISVDKVSLNLSGVSNSVLSLSAEDPFFSATEPAWGSPVEAGMAQSSITSWKLVYVQPRVIALRSITQQRQIIILIALATGLLMAVTSFLVAGSITRPISSLANTAEQIAAGDLSAVAEVGTKDEINVLANSFNHMTHQLRDTLSGLERRVAERTADVEMARLLSERRAQELQAISEISRIISSEQRLDILLPLITRLVSEKFDFYHVGIFFIDTTRRFAVLQAANSEGGQIMLARGHRLEVGQTGIVGNVAQTGEPRIALDVGSDAVFFDNADLPKTRSEMALPLNVRGDTIGVLDVQSTKPGAFSENDAKTLKILADQIAIAVDNARLFGQNTQSLNELQSLYNQYLRQEWKTFSQQESRVGYVQSVVGGRPLESPAKSEEIDQVLQAGEILVVQGKDSKSLPSISVPVKLRGQTIGVLNIKAPTKNRRWNKDEINLAQAISDRLALALDNARLLFESQRQTAKEQKIGEVTAKIGASINMRNVLQTAVEELGRALPGSEVVIQLQSENHDSSKN